MDNWIMSVFRLIGWINGLHTKVKSYDEIVEVQAQAKTVAGSHIIQYAREFELSLGLVFIVADGPDVSCVDEQGSVEFPPA